MGRHAPLRHLIAAAAQVATIAAIAAGCVADDGSGTGCPEVPGTFALTAPGGASELVPGGSVGLAWSPITAAGAVAGFVLVEGPRRVAVSGQIDLGLGGVDVALDASGGSIPLGIYRIEATFGGCATTSTVYDGGPLRLIYAQGLDFSDDQLAIDGNQTPRDLAFITVSLSTIDVELRVDPTPENPDDGDELAFARTTVPGELVRMTRRLAFTGDDLDGLPIPGGTYGVVAHVSAHMGTVTYDVRGPALDWTP